VLIYEGCVGAWAASRNAKHHPSGTGRSRAWISARCRAGLLALVLIVGVGGLLAACRTSHSPATSARTSTAPVVPLVTPAKLVPPVKEGTTLPWQSSAPQIGGDAQPPIADGGTFGITPDDEAKWKACLGQTSEIGGRGRCSQPTFIRAPPCTAEGLCGVWSYDAVRGAGVLEVIDQRRHGSECQSGPDGLCLQVQVTGSAARLFNAAAAARAAASASASATVTSTRAATSTASSTDTGTATESGSGGDSGTTASTATGSETAQPTVPASSAAGEPISTPSPSGTDSAVIATPGP